MYNIDVETYCIFSMNLHSSLHTQLLAKDGANSVMNSIFEEITNGAKFSLIGRSNSNKG
jgi:hypothetical protein